MVPLELWLSARELAAVEEGRQLEVVVEGWSSSRTALENDGFLRGLFDTLLAESKELDETKKLIQYAASEGVPVVELGHYCRKRLDARRAIKPSSGKPQLFVKTPFSQEGFNFQKVNQREKLLKLRLAAGPAPRTKDFHLLPNRYPLFACHLLLVSEALDPQQMTLPALHAIADLTSGCGFCVYFNSWAGGAASINHFHCHVIGEMPPVTRRPLVDGPVAADGKRCLMPQGFAEVGAHCYAFEVPSRLSLVDAIVTAMQEDEQPHNLLFTSTHAYIFPRPIVADLEPPPPSILRARAIYPENVGSPELIGSFTCYNREAFDALEEDGVKELMRCSTAPLPARALSHGGNGASLDARRAGFEVSARDEAREAREAAAAAQADLRMERQRAERAEAECERLAAQNAELVAELERMRKIVSWVEQDVSAGG